MKTEMRYASVWLNNFSLGIHNLKRYKRCELGGVKGSGVSVLLMIFLNLLPLYHFNRW